MKRILLIVGGVVVALVIAAAVVPFLVPGSVYKAQIEQAATKATGRTVTLAGDARLSVFPRIAASVKDVTVANPEGFSDPNMVEAGELRGAVRWMPLISGRVEVAELAFVDADVKLERLKDGRANWEFGTPSDDAPPAEEDAGGSVNAGVESARLENASLSYVDALSGQSYAVEAFTAEASLQALDRPLSAKGAGQFQGQPFSFDVDIESLQAALDGSATEVDINAGLAGAAADYGGTLTLGDAPALDGAMNASIEDITALLDLAGIDLPQAAALERIALSANASGPVSALALSAADISHTGALFQARYQGDIALGETPTLDGSIDATVEDVATLVTALALEIPQAAALEQIQVSTSAAGPVSALAMTGLSFSHTGALFEARYQGDVDLGASRLNGALAASSTRLRDLMSAFDVALAPGETLQSFSLSAQPSGSFDSIAMQGLDLKLDDIAMTGTASVDISGATPKIKADLSSSALDLSPFLASDGGSSPSSASSEGWSDAPLDLAGLKAVDADITLKTNALTLGAITLQDLDVAANLDGGNLKADLTKAQIFGGAWRGGLGVNASGETPSISLDMSGQSVAIQSLLSTFAGIDSVSGAGGVSVDVTSSGQSLKAIVEGLTGTFGMDLADGAVSGFNAGQLVRSAADLRTALASGQLSLGMSEEAETDFTDFKANFSVRDGIASVSALQVVNSLVTLDGSGSINLGGQSLDLSIVPSIDSSASGTSASAVQLNGVPIPFKLSGSWLSPSISPDTDLLRQALTGRLEAQARDEIADRIGDELGSGLSDALGLSRGQADDAEETPAEGDEEEDEQTLEDAAEDLARDALGGLFGRSD